MNPRLKAIGEQVLIIAACLVMAVVNVILIAAVWNMRWLFVGALPLLAYVLGIQLLRDWNEHRKRIEKLRQGDRNSGGQTISRCHPSGRSSRKSGRLRGTASQPA